MGFAYGLRIARPKEEPRGPLRPAATLAAEIKRILDPTVMGPVHLLARQEEEKAKCLGWGFGHAEADPEVLTNDLVGQMRTLAVRLVPPLKVPLGLPRPPLSQWPRRASCQFEGNLWTYA